MKSSLAEEMRPKTWEEYIGIPESIKAIREAISNDSPLSGVMIWGPTGVGKTSLAKLIVTSWLCMERLPGDSNPCGKCPVCLGQDTTNIFYYTPSGNKESGDGKSSAEVVGDMIARARHEPYVMPNKSGARNRYFPFINEMQNLSRGTLSSLLEPIEFGSVSTTWILTGMITDANTIDSALMEALSDRCLFIRIPLNTEEDIRHRLLEKFPQLSVSTARAISLLSNNKMREAWSHLSFFYPRIPIGDITPEMVYEQFGGGCCEESRREFWRALALSDVDVFSEILDRWLTRLTPSQVVDLLVQDMVSNPQVFKGEPNAVRGLCGALRTDLKRCPLKVVFLSYMGEVDLYGDRSVESTTLVRNKEYMELADVLVKELGKVLGDKTPSSGKELKNKVYNLKADDLALMCLGNIESIIEYYGT